MKITEDNIFEEAYNGNLEVRKSPLVDQVKDRAGRTPLHWLAVEGKVEVLNHPSVDKVRDNFGWTPLHWLAWCGRVEVLNHPSVDQVKEIYGRTPLHYLAGEENVRIEDLKERYPWFKFKKDQEVTRELITEILDTPQSVRFILGD